MADGLCTHGCECFFSRYLSFELYLILYLAIKVHTAFFPLRLCINDNDLYEKKSLDKPNVYSDVALNVISSGYLILVDNNQRFMSIESSELSVQLNFGCPYFTFNDINQS